MAKQDTPGPSTELVLSDEAEAFVEVLSGRAEASFEDPAEVQARIVRRILAAETADEAMADTPTYSTQDLVGVPFEVVDARVARSRFGDNGKGGFLVCYGARLDTGEAMILTTSSGKVAAKIAWHKMHGQLPARFRVTEPIESAQGFKVYDLAYA